MIFESFQIASEVNTLVRVAYIDESMSICTRTVDVVYVWRFK